MRHRDYKSSSNNSNIVEMNSTEEESKKAALDAVLARHRAHREQRRNAVIITETLLAKLSTDFSYGKHFVLAFRQDKAANNKEALSSWVMSEFENNNFSDLYEAEKYLLAKLHTLICE